MIHYNLASERRRIGMTQAQLGKELGFTVKTIGRWEKDISTMPGEIVIKAASLFNCSTDYLMDLTEDRRPRRSSAEPPASD